MGNCQGMPDSTFAALWSAALSVPDRDVFLSDPAFSAVPLDERGSVWDVAHMTIRGIRQHTGLSQAKFALHFCIPRRSVEDWEAGARTCPDYLRLLLAQAVGLYQR